MKEEKLFRGKTVNQIVDGWIEALESGNYKQTKGFLCTNEGYCCLGVLCEVVGYEKELKPEYPEIGGGVYGFRYGDNTNGAMTKRLNDVNLREFLGMGGVGDIKVDGKYIDGKYISLAEINDKGKADFKEIARLIKEHAEDLFRGQYKPAKV